MKFDETKKVDISFFIISDRLCYKIYICREMWTLGRLHTQF